MIKLPTLPKLSSLSRRERGLAALAVFAVSGAVLYGVVLGPWWTHTAKVRQEIVRLEEELKQQRRLLSRQTQLGAEAEAAGEAYRVLESGAMDMATILRELEKLGAESGINLGEVKPIEKEGAGSTLDVQSHGSLKAWIHFLYLIQTSSSLFEIERATMALTDEETGLLEGSLRLTSKMVRAIPATPSRE
jgi:hypothetical protein